MKRLILTLLFTSAALAHEPAEDRPRTKVHEAMLTTGAVVVKDHRQLGRVADFTFRSVTVTMESGTVLRGIEIQTPKGLVWLDEDEIAKFRAAIAKIRAIHADWQKQPAVREHASASFETPSGVGFEALRNVLDARGRRIDFNLIAAGERYPLTADQVGQLENFLTPTS